MKSSAFIQSDIDMLNALANWNADQQKVFDWLTDKNYGITFGDVAIYTRLGLSESKFYTLKREIKKKISRIITDC